MSSDVGTQDLRDVVARTAETLGVDPSELDYITPELLAHQLDASLEGIPVEEETADTPPNRISYISHLTIGWDGQTTYWQFYVNCRYDIRHVLESTHINRRERNGSCRTPRGTYVPRYKLWWHT